MEIHRGLKAVPDLGQTIVTSGTFDGVHFGHGRILKRVLDLSHRKGLPSAVLTFWPHPRSVIGKTSEPVRLLSTLEEKAERLAQLGIEHLVIAAFDKPFSEKSTEEYVQDVLIKALKTKHLVIGYDHRFGRGRAGNFAYLQTHADRFGFVVEEIPKQEIDDVAVSSTKIRDALRLGDIHTANRYLGYRYPATGVVVKGRQLGRQLGFPTANLQIREPSKLIPADGVYAVRIRYGGKVWGGMLNIGSRPTIGMELERSIEAHLFDFEGNIYGEHLTVEFEGFIRSEQKFDSLAALREQLVADQAKAKVFLKYHPH